MEQQFDNSDLPEGWSRTVSRSRPGTICYEHVNGRRLFRTPTAADDTFPKSGGRKHNNSTPQNVPGGRGSENPQDVGSVASVTRNSQIPSASNVSDPVSTIQTTPIRPSTESKPTPNSNSRGSRVAVIPQKTSESRTVARSIVKDDDDEFDFPGMGRKSSEAEGGKSSNNPEQDKSLNRSAAMETARPPHAFGSSHQPSSFSEVKGTKRPITTDEPSHSESGLAGSFHREKNEKSSDRSYHDSAAGRKNDRRSPPRRSTMKDRQRSRSPHHSRTTRVRSRSTDRPYERPGSRSSMDMERNSNRDRFGLNESGSVKRSYPSSSSSSIIATGTSLATKGPAETKVVTGNYVGTTSVKSMSSIPSDVTKTRKSDELLLNNSKSISTTLRTKVVESHPIMVKDDVGTNVQVAKSTNSHSGSTVLNSNSMKKSGSSTIMLDQSRSSPVSNLPPNKVSTDGAGMSTVNSLVMSESKKPLEARQPGSEQISMKQPSSTDPIDRKDEAVEKLAQSVIDSLVKNTSAKTQGFEVSSNHGSRTVSEEQSGTQKSESQSRNGSRNGEVLSEDASLKLMAGSRDIGVKVVIKEQIGIQNIEEQASLKPINGSNDGKVVSGIPSTEKEASLKSMKSVIDEANQGSSGALHGTTKRAEQHGGRLESNSTLDIVAKSTADLPLSGGGKNLEGEKKESIFMEGTHSPSVPPSIVPVSGGKSDSQGTLVSKDNLRLTSEAETSSSKSAIIGGEVSSSSKAVVAVVDVVHLPSVEINGPPPESDDLTRETTPSDDAGKGLSSIKHPAHSKNKKSDQSPPVRESLGQSEVSNLLNPQQQVVDSTAAEIPPSVSGIVTKQTMEANEILQSSAGTVSTKSNLKGASSVEFKDGSFGRGRFAGDMIQESNTPACNASNYETMQEKSSKKSGGGSIGQESMNVGVEENATTTSKLSKPAVVDVTVSTTTNNNNNASQVHPLAESSSTRSEVQLLRKPSSTSSSDRGASSREDINKLKGGADGLNATTTNASLNSAPTPGGSTVSLIARSDSGGGESAGETSNNKSNSNFANLVVAGSTSNNGSNVNASVKASDDHNKDTVMTGRPSVEVDAVGKAGSHANMDKVMTARPNIEVDAAGKTSSHANMAMVLSRPSVEVDAADKATSRVDVQSFSVEGRMTQETHGSKNSHDASVALPKSAAPNVVASERPPLKTSLSTSSKETTTTTSSAKPPSMTSLTRKRHPPPGPVPADKPPLVTSVSSNNNNNSSHQASTKFSSSVFDSTKDRKPPLTMATRDPGSSSVARSVLSNNDNRPLSSASSSTHLHPSQQHQLRQQQNPRGSTDEVLMNDIQEQDRKRARLTDSHSQRSGSSERSVASDNTNTRGVQDSRPPRLPSPPIQTSSASRNSMGEPAAVLGGSNVAARDNSNNKNSLEKPSAVAAKSSATSGSGAIGQEKEVVAQVAANPLTIREWMERNLLMSPASRKAVSDNHEELRRLGAVLATSLAKNISTVCMESSLAYDVVESLMEGYSVDLSACFVPDFPNCAAQFFKRFGMLYPAESTSWYVAKTHAYYMTLVAMQKKESESKQEQQSVVMAVRISGLPEEHKLLNGLYVRPTLPTQPGESIKKETYIFKKGETNDAIVETLLGRFALIHFTGRQWTLQRIDRANQLTCLATGNDAATSWVYATGMGEGALAWRSASSIKLELLTNSD